jgi:hypothetical protein
MERGEHRGGGHTASIRADREGGRRCPPTNTTSLLRATPRVCAQKESTARCSSGAPPEPDQTIGLKARPHLTIGSRNRSGLLRRKTTPMRAACGSARMGRAAVARGTSARIRTALDLARSTGHLHPSCIQSMARSRQARFSVSSVPVGSGYRTVSGAGSLSSKVRCRRRYAAALARSP